MRSRKQRELNEKTHHREIDDNILRSESKINYESPLIERVRVKRVLPAQIECYDDCG